jgi:hypothetical protein
MTNPQRRRPQRRTNAALLLALFATNLFCLHVRSAPPPPARPAVLMPLQAVAFPEDLRRGVEGDIRRALPGQGVQALAEADATDLLRAIESAGVACQDKSEECIIRIGALAAVDIVVAGTLSKSPSGGITLELVLFDVAALQARARASVPLDLATPTARQASVTQAVVGILRPEAWRGQLKVTVQQPGATIVVDGIPRGFSPLPQSIALVPGPHEVWVGLEGFRTHHERVDVAYQKRMELKVALTAGVSEPLPISVPSLVPKAAPAEKETTSTTGPKPARKTIRVAVYEPTIAGVPERLARIVSSYVAAEVRKRERTSVLGGDELRAMMQASTGNATLGECSEERCLSEVADALGVDVVVLVQITAAEGEIFFGIRRIDQADQEVTGAVSERVADVDLAALLPLIGPSVQRLFPDVPLRPGETAGVDERAERVLRPPPLPPAVATSMFVLTGLSAAASAVFFMGSENARRTFEATASRASEQDGSVLYADVVAEREAAVSASTTSLATLGLTGLALVTSGVLSVFTDWEGLAAVQEAPP